MNVTAPCRTPQPNGSPRSRLHRDRFARGRRAVPGIDHPTIIASVASLQCLEYRIVGICYWLLCTPFGYRANLAQSPSLHSRAGGVSYSDTGSNPGARCLGFRHRRPSQGGAT
jgi:hypothetical protein